MVRGRWISCTSRIFSIVVGLPTGSDSATTPLAGSRIVWHLVLRVGLVRLTWLK